MSQSFRKIGKEVEIEEIDRRLPNFMMYTMVILVILTEFQVKITMIGEAIAKNVILDQI